jgi:hypothetical protein
LRSRAAGALLVTGAAVAIMVPVASVMVGEREIGDFRAHIGFAEDLTATLAPPIPHFLFALAVSLLRVLLRSYQLSAVVVVVTAEVALGIILYRWLLRATSGPHRGLMMPMGVAGLTIALMVAGPGSLLLSDGFKGHYLGYIVPSSYHSPTQLVLKPLALVLFLLCVEVLRPPAHSRRAGPATVGLTAALVVLSTLAKPSYTMCVVPALLV